MPKVLIVIVVYNGIDYLKECLTSLLQTNYPKESFEILVIDNQSTDGSVEYLKQNWSKIKLVVNQQNLGFAQANNLGLEQAINKNFDYAYLLNQDTVVTPDFLNQAVKVAEVEPKIGAVQSKLLLYHNKGKINSIGNEIHYLGFAFAGGYQLPDQPLDIKEITYPSGASVLLNVKALKEVGVFNPDFFMYHEDVDLGWRMWLEDYKVMLAPESVVYHKYEFSRSIKKYYFMERNRRLVFIQNYKLGTIILLLPAYFVMCISMLIYSFFAGWWFEYLKTLGYMFSPQNWKKIIKTRRQIQKIRRVSDKEIIKRFVGKIEFQDLENPLLKYVANPIFNVYWQIVKRLIWW